MANEFSTGKSIFILAIVAGCFAVLWPNIFYPMLIGSYSGKNVPTNVEGCCDVLFDSDVNAIKIMTQLCRTILSHDEDFDRKFLFSFEQGKLTKDIVNTCQSTVLNKCGIDITEFLREKVKLGRTYKQMLDGIRSLNSSLCLKHSFGVSISQIGHPRHIRVWGLNMSKHMRQERPPHLRPESMHPALREKGRAIPQSHVLPKANIQEGRPGPLPGLRPPMGGAGHVVPPPKGSGTMGIVMPMYTIGIVVFFLYTMMKLMFKKSEENSTYEGFTTDPEFRRTVFDNSSRYINNKDIVDDPTKLVVSAISGLVQEVNKQIRQDQAQPLSQNKQTQEEPVEEREDEPPTIINKVEKGSSNNDVLEDEIEAKGAVKVLGMEMTESCEGGAKWSRPPTPQSRPPTPQNIYLPGSILSQSQLLVSDSHIETQSEQDNAVVLTGKVTLSLIGLINSEIMDEESTDKSKTVEKTRTIPSHDGNQIHKKAETEREQIETSKSVEDSSDCDVDSKAVHEDQENHRYIVKGEDEEIEESEIEVQEEEEKEELKLVKHNSKDPLDDDETLNKNDNISTDIKNQ